MWLLALVVVQQAINKINNKLNIQKTKIVASCPNTSWQIDGETMETITDFLGGTLKSLQMVTAAMKLMKLLFLFGRKAMINLESILKSRDTTLPKKGPYSQSYGFSSSHVWMWELDYKESWAPKNWCFWTVVLEKTLESPLDCKAIQPVNTKENQSWIFIGRTDAEAETLVLWPPDAKNWLLRKDPDVGKDWRKEEKGTTEDEIVGWHDWLDGHEFEQSPRNGEAWCAAVHGVTKSRTRLSDWTELKINKMGCGIWSFIWLMMRSPDGRWNTQLLAQSGLPIVKSVTSCKLEGCNSGRDCEFGNEWMDAHSLAAPQTPPQCLVHLQTYITSSPFGHSHGRCLLPLSATLSVHKYQYLGGFYSEAENFMDGNAKELSINIVSLRMREKLHICKVKGTIRRIIKLQNSRKWKSLTHVRLFATPWTT